jgi:hypothetical protein
MKTNDLRQKLIATQIVKKFPAFYGTRRFITVFTTARHKPISWARWIQSTPHHSMSLRSILMLSSHLRVGPYINEVFRSQDFVCISNRSHTCYMPRPSLSHHHNIWWSVQVMKFLIMHPALPSCHFLPLRSKYSPQHLVLKTPSSYVVPSEFHTRIKQKRTDSVWMYIRYWSVYFDCCFV